MLGTGSWASVTKEGCTYSFFAQYACSRAPTSQATLEPPLESTLELGLANTAESTPDLTKSSHLTAYWDSGTCGPYGDDHNRAWCPGDPATCSSQVVVSSSVCSTVTADLTSLLGTGSEGSVTIDGCKYGFFAKYACSGSGTGRRLAATGTSADAAGVTSSEAAGISTTLCTLAGVLCFVGALFALVARRGRGHDSPSPFEAKTPSHGSDDKMHQANRGDITNVSKMASDSVTETEVNTNLMMLDLDNSADTGTMSLPL